MSYFLRFDPAALCIAVVLVHNGTALANRAQTTRLMSLLTQQQYAVLNPDGTLLLDDAGHPVLIPYWTFTGLARPHEVCVWHFIPFGATRPTNIVADIRGGIITDNVGVMTPIRTFHCMLTRPEGYAGADVTLHIASPALFTLAKLQAALGRAEGWLEQDWGRVLRKGVLARLLEAHPKLREDWTLADAIADYKARLVAGGIAVG